MRCLTSAFAALVFWGGAAAAEEPAQRIVVAGGDLAEIVYALGAEDRIVALDSTATYPPEVKDKAQIGYVRRLAAEGILSMKPDLVIGAYDMGPPTVIDQLRATGLRVAIAPDGKSADGVADKIRFVGKELALVDKANALADKVTADLATAVAEATKHDSKPRVVFILSVSDRGLRVGGQETSADSIITMAGGTNAAEGFDGYKIMSQESMLQARPDVILMMNGSAHRYGGMEKVLARPELKLTPAAKNERFVVMDGTLLLGFGPRTPEAVRQLSGKLHANGG